MKPQAGVRYLSRTTIWISCHRYAPKGGVLLPAELNYYFPTAGSGDEKAETFYLLLLTSLRYHAVTQEVYHARKLYREPR